MRNALLVGMALAISACVTQPPPAARAVRASAYNAALEAYMVVVWAGKDRGIYARHGLDVRWSGEPGRAVDANQLRVLVSDGVEMGLSSPAEVLLARSRGVPVRIVGGFVGDTLVDVYVRANGPVREPRDLAGRTVGATSPAVHRRVPVLGQAYGIAVHAGPLASLDENIAALREGRIDAIITAEARVLPPLRTGELRRLLRTADIRPRPELNNALWATEDAIAHDADTVRAFVQAVLDTVAMAQREPGYAARIVASRTGMAAEDAAAAVARIDWVPGGQPGGDLLLATRNYLGALQSAGAMPEALRAEDVVDARFVR